VATSKDYSIEDFDNSDNNKPFKCDTMHSSSDEDETASIQYLKRNLDPSLRYWEGVAFYKTERSLNNACIWAENFHR
jgi:hypothetical protein